MKTNRLNPTIAVCITMAIITLLAIGAAYSPFSNPTTSAERFTATGNDTGTLALGGGCLYAVEVKCTDDDAITVTLSSALGSEMYALTTTGATSGEFQIVDDFFPINRPVSYAITNNTDSAGCVVEVTSWQR